MRTLPAAILPGAAVLWLSILCLAPIALSRGVSPVATITVYKASAVLCHQRADRSFRAAGVQMPVCARCFGLYASGAIGALAALLLRHRGSRVNGPSARFALGLSVQPVLLSVALEWVGAIEGSNITRFASALPLGAVAGWLVQGVAAGATRPMRYHSLDTTI